MESNTDSATVTFQVLQKRLILFINTRILNGDFTERGLAKLLGVSQPQIHNVLKGARKLKPELADRLFRRFGMSVLDLLESSELYEEVLARGPVEVGRELANDKVGEHLPPRRLEPERPPRKRPVRQSSGQPVASAEQAS